jgi:hypothetical protein
MPDDHGRVQPRIFFTATQGLRMLQNTSEPDTTRARRSSLRTPRPDRGPAACEKAQIQTRDSAPAKRRVHQN